MSDYDERMLLQAKAEYAKSEAARLAALALVPDAHIKADRAHPLRTELMFVTLWLCQLLTWGFLMMTFRKDVWPHA